MQTAVKMENFGELLRKRDELREIHVKIYSHEKSGTIDQAEGLFRRVRELVREVSELETDVFPNINSDPMLDFYLQS